jgi:hypothetical protein
MVIFVFVARAAPDNKERIMDFDPDYKTAVSEATKKMVVEYKSDSFSTSGT